MSRSEYSFIDILRVPFKYSKKYALLIAFQKLIDGLIPSIQVLITTNFLDNAMQILKDKKDFSRIIIPTLFLILVIAYTWLSDQIIKFAYLKLEFAFRENFSISIMEKRAKLKYKYIEDNETWNLISRVSKKPEIVLKNAYINTLCLICMFIKVGGLLFIVATQVLWAGITIFLLSIPLMFLATRGGRISYNSSREMSKYIRKSEYLAEVLTGREAVSERNLFCFTDKINEKWKIQYEISRKIQFKSDLKYFIRLKIGSISTILISIVISIILIKPVLDKVLSVTKFIAIVNGVFSLIQLMSWQLSYYLKELSKNKEYLKDLNSFINLSELDGALDLPSTKNIKLTSLEFKNVSFKYPGTDKYILKNLSFKIKGGMTYAFVGSNGAGKTTIIKLLTGLYEEFEGEVLINNKNIKEYKQSELKSIYSVVYQDFAKYYVSVKDNISIGNVNEQGKTEQEKKIKKAINIMQLQETVKLLSNGMDTPLGKIKNNGQDLSGGEWQRIAMARSNISSSALKILDEPTAALDPIIESNMYNHFKEISQGSTTIFITHRLASTKLAHEIFVLDKGSISEKGTHDELMKKNGLYAKMYESQRSWYL